MLYFAKIFRFLQLFLVGTVDATWKWSYFYIFLLLYTNSIILWILAKFDLGIMPVWLQPALFLDNNYEFTSWQTLYYYNLFKHLSANPTKWSPQDFSSMLDHFSTLCMKGSKYLYHHFAMPQKCYEFSYHQNRNQLIVICRTNQLTGFYLMVRCPHNIFEVCILIF